MDIPVVGASAGVCGMIAIVCSIPADYDPDPLVPGVLDRLFDLRNSGPDRLRRPCCSPRRHLGRPGLCPIFGGPSGVGSLVWATRTCASSWSLAKNTRRRRPHPEAQRASEFISREVGPILDKIAAQGLDSLTDKERKTLAAARQRMGKNAG